jgi:hypothetical protein
VGVIEGVTEGAGVGDVVGTIVDVVGEGVEEVAGGGRGRGRVGNEMNMDCNESNEITELVTGKSCEDVVSCVEEHGGKVDEVDVESDELVGANSRKSLRRGGMVA